MLQVRLDEGAVKDVNCDYVRMLPPSFLNLSNGFTAFSKDKTKEAPSNTYASSKNKPNILLGKAHLDFKLIDFNTTPWLHHTKNFNFYISKTFHLFCLKSEVNFLLSTVGPRLSKGLKKGKKHFRKAGKQ
jgi:hypothetical protein